MKTRKGVQKIYSEVADTYELVNHILTFGLDIRWRKTAAHLALKQNRNTILDVCSGTGEMAQAVVRHLGADARVFSTDFSYPMLIRARRRIHMPEVSFVLAEAGELPFIDETFDLVTISFATRNLNIRREILLAYLKEFYRTLDQGGAFVNVETSQPPNPLLRKIFHAYVSTFVRPIGSFFSGSKPGYRYLAYTIPRFYSADEFSSLLYSAGFSHVKEFPLMGGIAAIHLALK
jgi:demethylmenaquinone methyltransferase/2-methoxy-6-polyprenyl-1,4-benzoquinol methylase